MRDGTDGTEMAQRWHRWHRDGTEMAQSQQDGTEMAREWHGNGTEKKGQKWCRWHRDGADGADGTEGRQNTPHSQLTLGDIRKDMGFLQHVIAVAPDFTIFITFMVRCLKGILLDTPGETPVSPVNAGDDPEMVWQEFYDDAATFWIILQSAESAASLFISPYEALLPSHEARKSPYAKGSVQVIGTDASQYVGGGANITLGEKWRLLLPHHVRRDILASFAAWGGSRAISVHNWGS